MIPFLIDALQDVGSRVPYRSVVHPSAGDSEITAELYKLMTMQTRVFIVHMPPSLGSWLFARARQIGMMGEGYVWILTTGITNHLSLIDPYANNLMQGVVGVKPHVPRRKSLKDFITRWKRMSRRDNINVDLSIFGLWAYDAATALAMAIEKIWHEKYSNLHRMNISGSMVELESLAVSQIHETLSPALSSTKFRGVSGDFNIVDGQLQSSSFVILNVAGNRERGVGFWTPENGIIKKLYVTETKRYTSSKADLKPIVWPGNTTTIPKGWVIPTNGKKLRIGVPVRSGASDFVNVIRDSSTNRTTATGFCIDVFDAVMEALPYYVPYEYIPFAKHNGMSAGSYNDLVYQVFVGNYDATVGDITISEDRSLYVDFTLPYTESAVTMVVPVKDTRRNNAWAFLKPFTWPLWATIICLLVFMGFVIWILGHPTNEESRGRPPQQFGTSCLVSVSTLVSSVTANKEIAPNNLARVVMMVGGIVVLILTQSYTASLFSVLTVPQLKPTVTDVHELIQKGENVGYPKGSFVLELLKQLKIDDSKLVEFDTLDDLDIAFSKGTANGGIAAAFDETLYMKHFVAKHCSKYTMVGQILKTGGLGFAFPLNSPLVPDVSRAILSVAEGGKLTKIEKAWFGQETACPDSSISSTSSSRLDLFGGLFLIVAVASSFALIIHFCMLLYEQRHFIMTRFDFKIVWKKTPSIVSRCFKNNNEQGNNNGAPNGPVTILPTVSAQASANTSSPFSQSNFSDAASSGDLDHSDERATGLADNCSHQNLDVAFSQEIVPTTTLLSD